MSWWAAAFQALGSAIGNRSSRKGNDQQMDAMRRMQEMEMAQQRRNMEAQRRWDLEDRRYREEAIGGYRALGNAGLTSPEYSSTEPSPIGIPQGVPENERPRNNNQGLMFFR